MKYLFCSSVYDMREYDRLAAKSKVQLSLADHNLNYNIIVGMEEALGHPIKLINNAPIPNYPNYPKIWFKKLPWSHTEGGEDIHCGFINLPVLKHLSRAVTTYAALKKEIKAAGQEPVCAVTYELRLGMCLAMKKARRRFKNLRMVAVLPDIPTAVIKAATGGTMDWKARLRAAIKMRFIKQFDAYVVITDAMREVSPVGDKPSVVLEGIYNSHQPPLAEKTTDKKVILYTGQLNPAYDLETLFDAFEALYAEDPTHELWLCGGGKLVPYINEMAQRCPGVKYYGYVNAAAVRGYQAEATLLVNPRQNTDEFTRFSFPSKTMEYLASGRPVVGYKLDGIPAEYDPHIQYVPANDVDTLKETLRRVCSLPAEERAAIGAAAREFILREKNPKAMCTPVVAMCEDLFKNDTKRGDV